MGEEGTLFPLEFNRSIRIEARPDRLTADAGVVLLREVIKRLGITDWLVDRLHDPRSPEYITHPLSELLNTSLLLLAQGWRDHDDADFLRDDPALRLAVSERGGISPLIKRPRTDGQRLSRNPDVPDGLASQPTLSRLVAMLADPFHRAVLRQALMETAARRMKAMGVGRLGDLVIDVDSLPVSVEGHQPGSEHNGHYHARIYHPLIASVAETGDLLDAELRDGNVHTADGAIEFMLRIVDEATRLLCERVTLRFDAGFPGEPLLAALEARSIPYLARLINNKVLDRMAAPHLTRPPGRPPAEPRIWCYEKTYQAQSWSHERRVVLVVLERPDELLLHHFWIVTNSTLDEIHGRDLLATYRARGTAEARMGELMDVLAPALSSSPRPKSHYRGQPVDNAKESCDSFGHNEVRLLLNALAYNILHTTRALLGAASGTGWSLRRLRERLLRVPARLLIHGRRAILVVASPFAALWNLFAGQLAQLRLAEA